MSEHVLNLYLQALEIYATIEGMKAENQSRAYRGESPAYTEDDFLVQSGYLQNIRAKIG